MRILYVDGKEIFAKTNLLIASVENPQAAENFVHVTTFSAAVLELEKAKAQEPFDLIISALVYEGAAAETGVRGNLGGIDLFRFCHERNIQSPFCFLTRPEGYRIVSALDRAGLMPREDTRFFRKGTPLMEIIKQCIPERTDRVLSDARAPDVHPR